MNKKQIEEMADKIRLWREGICIDGCLGTVGSTTYQIAEDLYNEGYRKVVWHKVADGDLPKRQNADTYAIPIQAYYIDFSGIKGNGPLYFYFIDNTFRNLNDCKPVNVIAWTELPKYEE